MARISLRTYHREIETLIERGQYDQAIAHCKHIIQSFPKNIATYRLLGKCFLESQHYGNASDIFQRVLSSVPDDFLSHVGLSMIREDEGNLHDAIWNMERAFEVQPANNAIQAELRRLYERRDGFEPPKLRLTRGALARMYIKGELYQQAIAELRAALREEPERLDLRTLLAEAYFASGKRVEAAETSSAILQKLPYSLAANRILADVLEDSERANEASAYRQRVLDLDPYRAHTSPAAPTAEQVPDGTVNIERLSWRPGQPSPQETSQPDWAASLGVNVSDLDAEQNEIPDWLVNAAGGSAQSIDSLGGIEKGSNVFLFDDENDDDQKDQEEAIDLVLNQDENEEFLALFDSEETDEEEEDTAVFDFGTEDVLPEWMIEPEEGDSSDKSSTDQPEASQVISEYQDELEKEEQFESEPGDEDIPEWLQSLGGQEGKLENESLEGIESPSPTWLDEEESGTDESRQGLNDSLDTGDDQSTDMDMSKTEEEGTAMNVENDDLPEWLKELNTDANKQASTEPEGESVDEPTQSVDLDHDGIDDEAELAPADMPDWMKDLQPDDTVAETSEMSDDSGLISDDEQEAAYAWLEGLAAKQGVDQDELFLSSEQQSESPPEWIQEEKEPSAPEQVSSEISSDIDEIEETVISSTQAAGEEEAIEEVPDWLKDLSDKETMVSSEFEVEEITDTKEAESEEKLLEETAEVPDWLQSLEPGEIESQEDVLEASQGEISMQKNRDFDTEPQDEHDLDWITETPTSELPHAEAVANEDEELPDWLMDVVDDSQESPEDELPDWLIEPELDADKAARATDFERQVSEAPDFQDSLSLEDEPPVDEEDTQPSQLVKESEDGEPPEVIPVPEDVVPLPTQPQEWVSEEIEPTQEGEQIEPESEETILESSMEISAEEESEIAVDDEIIHLQEDIEEVESPIETAAELEAADVSSQEIEEASPEHNLEDADAAFAWLESLAAKQGVEEALLLSPEERREEPPEWVKDAAQSVTEDEPDVVEEFEEPGELIEEEISQSQISEDDLLLQENDVELERDASPELETEAASDEDIITRAEVEEPEEIPFSLDTSEELEAKSPEEKVVPELPDWLADIETETASEETQEWELPVESPVSEQQPAPQEQFIEQPVDINIAGLADLERLPGVGFVRAQAILAFRRAHGSINSLEDLLEVEGFGADIIDGLSGKVTFAASQVVPDETIIAGEATEAQIKLTEARNALVSDEMAIAVEKYQELIESESLLQDIITDLNEALFRHPASLDILQSLGDAYLRNGQIKDAIDAFAKAENLLR